MAKDIMQYEPILPPDFDGVFRFTNDSNEDFIGKWASKEYLFLAKTTSPIPAHLLNATPLEVQQIRKKFALDWAVREFGKSGSYENYLKQERNTDGSPRLNSIQQAGSYSIDQLTPFIQRCLKPLDVAKAIVTEVVKEPLENKLSRNDSGELNSTAIDKKISLRKKAEIG